MTSTPEYSRRYHAKNREARRKYMRNRRNARIADGKCPRCENPPAKNRIHCSECLKYENLRKRLLTSSPSCLT